MSFNVLQNEISLDMNDTRLKKKKILQKYTWNAFQMIQISFSTDTKCGFFFVLPRRQEAASETEGYDKGGTL